MRASPPRPWRLTLRHTNSSTRMFSCDERGRFNLNARGQASVQSWESKSKRLRALLTPRRLLSLFIGVALGVFVLAVWLRHVRGGLNVWLYGEVEITTAFLALTFAALALVRFRGTS